MNSSRHFRSLRLHREILRVLRDLFTPNAAPNVAQVACVRRMSKSCKFTKYLDSFTWVERALNKIVFCLVFWVTGLKSTAESFSVFSSEATGISYFGFGPESMLFFFALILPTTLEFLSGLDPVSWRLRTCAQRLCFRKSASVKCLVVFSNYLIYNQCLSNALSEHLLENKTTLVSILKSMNI